MARRPAAAAAPGLFTAATRLAVLYGPEEMFKREHLDQLRAALVQAHGEVQVQVFDGAQAPLADVLDELRTYSLMSAYKLVIVDHADEFAKQHRDALERYAAAPVDQATLVLRSDLWHPGKLDKLVAKAGAIVKCETPAPAEARQWVQRRVQQVHGRTLAPAAAEALVDRLGADLMLIDSELGKVVLAAADQPADQPIAPAVVEQVVGRSSDEKAWAIQEAVLHCLSTRGNGAGAQLLGKLHELIDLAGHDPVPLTYAIADLMRKLHLAAVLRRRRVNDFEIGRALGLWGEQITLLTKVVGRFEPRQLRRWFEQAVDLDRRGKSGQGEPVRNLECFCATLADEIR